MTDERLARLRADRDVVVAALQVIEERAAICEHDGRLSRVDAERLAWDELFKQTVVPESDEMPLGIHCPFCQCRRFDDEPRGMRCRSCSRLAWLFLANGSAVRADCEKLDLRLDA